MKKKYSKYTMCVHYKDTDVCIKEVFETEKHVLEWFESFKQVNKRPVTITHYCGCVPYWVYYKE